MRIALFISCLADTFFPRMGIATVRLLEHLGHEVIFPREQTCCGQPMYNSGYAAHARDLARRMCDVFEQYESIVTPSASCAAMVRVHFRELFQPGSTDHERAHALAQRTYELIEFLVKVAHFEAREHGIAWPEVATLHRTCHQRDLGLRNESADLLQAIQGVEFRPLANAEQCCGFGGMFATKYPTLSAAMAADKVDAIRASAARTVICNEPGCTMNIEGACRRAGVDVRFVSLAEVLAERLGLMEDVAEGVAR